MGSVQLAQHLLLPRQSHGVLCLNVSGKSNDKAPFDDVELGSQTPTS